ncbi:hypothetical protein [Spirillospora sp. NPDC047279]|uniref:hypothetical protein n=1 Tax=Spirillospora sp. NPDC047279 TaxID=3155478 RepID=UPI0033F6D585
MDLQGTEAVAARLAGEFGTRPPKVTAGRPQPVGLGIRGKFYGRRPRLVIDPAVDRLTPDELEGQLAGVVAAFTLRRGFFARALLSFAAVCACGLLTGPLLSGVPSPLRTLAGVVGVAVWLALLILAHRGWIYRADRRVVEVRGTRHFLAALEAERRYRPVGGPVSLRSMPDPDRRAERVASGTASAG